MSNSIPITVSALTYWVGLVGGVVFVSKKDKFVPSTNDGIGGIDCLWNVGHAHNYRKPPRYLML